MCIRDRVSERCVPGFVAGALEAFAAHWEGADQRGHPFLFGRAEEGPVSYTHLRAHETRRHL
eukprot:10491077-Prorocentrum_lima.AAC.1